MDCFDQIVLTRDELKDLKKAYRGKLRFRHIDPNDALIKYGLLFCRRGKENPEVAAVRITDKGRRYVIYMNQRAAFRRVEWIRYIITTGIALAAFIKSFFF